MSQEEMIAETNQLLKRYIELEDDRLQQQKETEAKLLDRKPLFDDKKMEDVNKRHEELLAQSRTRINFSQERQTKYQDDVLAELKLQSELLQKIADKLGV